MDGLIELIFEGIPDDALGELVSRLLVGVPITNLQHSVLKGISEDLLKRDVVNLLKAHAGSSIFIRASPLKIGVVPIKNPFVRITRYADTNEFTVVFNRNDVVVADPTTVVADLARGAEVLAGNLNVLLYYCGFEPANDGSTQLFVNNRLGPLVRI